MAIILLESFVMQGGVENSQWRQCSGDYIGAEVLQFISVGKSNFSGLGP